MNNDEHIQLDDDVYIEDKGSMLSEPHYDKPKKQ